MIAIMAARLRAEYNLKTPDAIQLATAKHFGAKYFYSADKKLPKKIDSLVIKVIS